MKLIDLYVAEVGKRLPAKNRADIENEIRSILLDMLEERSQAAGRPADESMIRDLLKEYGTPSKVAESYLPEQYVVGPRLFPIFMLVLKIVLAVLVGVSLMNFGIRFTASPMAAVDFFSALGKVLVELFSSMMAAFGNIVLVFAILERTLPKSEFEKEQDEWTPDELEEKAEPETFSIMEPVIAIVFTVAAMIIFNVYPEVIGMGFVAEGKWIFIPALSREFFALLPWLNVIWALQIALNLVLFRQGRWTPATRWSAMAINALGLVFIFALLRIPSIVSFSPESLAAANLAPDVENILTHLLDSITKGALIIALIVNVVEMVRRGMKMVTRKI